MSISIFAKKTTWGRSGHLQRVSSMIRGVQAAEQIGAKLNPESGYENDVCIYVKPHVPKGYDFTFEGRKPYLDMVDGHNLGRVLIKHPEVPAIVCSQTDYEIMRQAVSNEIIVIPQHHCNFERIKKTIEEVNTVGVIGTEGAFPFLPKELRKELEKRGMRLVEFSTFRRRQDVMDFYLKIDIQIVWRPYKKILSNPLKIVNAASFGIPTIALDEKAFWEMKGCYLPVANFQEFLSALDALKKSKELYKALSDSCLARTEAYHIENIGKLYKNLDT